MRILIALYLTIILDAVQANEPLFIIERTLSSEADAKKSDNFILDIHTLSKNLVNKGRILTCAENENLLFISWVDREGLIYFYAVWKNGRPNSKLSVNVEQLNPLNITQELYSEEPLLLQPTVDKQPQLKSIIQEKTAKKPGIIAIQSGFGVKCYKMGKLDKGIEYLLIKVNSLENGKIWRNHLSIILRSELWKPWEVD